MQNSSALFNRCGRHRFDSLVVVFALLLLINGSLFGASPIEITAPVAGGIYERDRFIIAWSAPEVIGNVKIEFSDGEIPFPDGDTIIFRTVAEIPATQGQLDCFLNLFDVYNTGSYLFYNAVGTEPLNERYNTFMPSNASYIKISGDAGYDSDGLRVRQETLIGPFQIKHPTTYLEVIDPKPLEIGKVFKLRATTSAPAPFVWPEYSTDNGTSWKRGSLLISTNSILKLRISQQDNSSNFTLIDTRNESGSGRGIIIPDYTNLPLGKPILFRAQAGAFGDPSNSIPLLISTLNTEPVRKNIRGRVGRRLKKSLRSVDGVPKRSRRLPRGLRFKPAIGSIVGRPRRIARTTVVFTDERKFRTIVRFKIRGKASRER